MYQKITLSNLTVLFLIALLSPIKTNALGICSLTKSTKSITSIVSIEGHVKDNLIIENCTFENIKDHALQIRNVDNLVIRNNIFKNISGSAILLRNSGSSNNIQITNNHIFNIQQCGIFAGENHYNTLVARNTIHDIALSNAGSLRGEPCHGIYFQGKKFTIKNNTIYNIMNNDGNAISVRSYGVIDSNTASNSTKYGISYFPDHPGRDGSLLIQNNIIYDNSLRGIGIYSAGNITYHVQNIIMRFNTIVSTSASAPIGLGVGLINIGINIYGNILIRADGGSSIYAGLTTSYKESFNIKAKGDVGFVDFQNRNLHLKSTSPAQGFVPRAASNAINNDFDGHLRNNTNLDAGADEVI